MSRYKLSVPDFGAIWPKIPTDLFGGLRLSKIFPRVPGLQAISALNPVRGHIATAVETAAAPVSRALSPYEIEEIARRVAAEMLKSRRRKVQSVVDVEVIEASVEPGYSHQGLVPSGTTRNPSELPSERRLKALRLLRKLKKAKYQSIKLVAIVEQMIERADLGLMADTFEAEKKALRKWLRTQPMPSIRGKRKNEGQLPKPSTFDKNINSLQPIYQELFESMPSKLAANSEVIAAA